MIKRELSKDPKLAKESWDRFLPKFKKKNVKRKKKKAKKEKKPYTPFPPPQPPSKLDLQLESGEYFLTQYQKEHQKKKEKAQKRWEQSQLQKVERQKSFVPPEVRRFAKEMIASGTYIEFRRKRTNATLRLLRHSPPRTN